MQVWDLGRLYKTQVSRNEIWNVNYCFSNVLFWQKTKKIYIMNSICWFGTSFYLDNDQNWAYNIYLLFRYNYSTMVLRKAFSSYNCICDKWHKETEYFSWSYINSMTPRQHLIFQKQHYVQLLIPHVKKILWI